MEKSTAEVEALEESVLYREKMVGFEEPVVQAAAKEKKELVNAYKQLCGVLQTGNVQDWMHTMWNWRRARQVEEPAGRDARRGI